MIGQIGSIGRIGRIGVTSTGGPPLAPPVNTVAPAITGTPQVGQTLSVTNGTWTGSPTGYARQWKRGTTNVGANSNDYTLVEADVGATMTCVVTATNDDGPASALSNSVGPVVAAPTVGQRLYTTGGTFVVPAGVTSISAAAVSSGLEGNSDGESYIQGGSGGACAWQVSLPVTAGETLTVVVQNGASGTAGVLREGVGWLLRAYGAAGPNGGTVSVGEGFNGGGGSGTAWGGATSGASAGHKGGAGSAGRDGEVGGGNGCDIITLSPTGNSGLQNGGSYGGGAGFAFGTTGVPGSAAVRIIWGAGREYPSTNTGDV